jgi:hypothetical protein
MLVYETIDLWYQMRSGGYHGRAELDLVGEGGHGP